MADVALSVASLLTAAPPAAPATATPGVANGVSALLTGDPATGTTPAPGSPAPADPFANLLAALAAAPAPTAPTAPALPAASATLPAILPDPDAEPKSSDLTDDGKGPDGSATGDGTKDSGDDDALAAAITAGATAVLALNQPVAPAAAAAVPTTAPVSFRPVAASAAPLRRQEPAGATAAPAAPQADLPAPAVGQAGNPVATLPARLAVQTASDAGAAIEPCVAAADISAAAPAPAPTQPAPALPTRLAAFTRLLQQTTSVPQPAVTAAISPAVPAPAPEAVVPPPLPGVTEPAAAAAAPATPVTAAPAPEAAVASAMPVVLAPALPEVGAAKRTEKTIAPNTASAVPADPSSAVPLPDQPAKPEVTRDPALPGVPQPLAASTRVEPQARHAAAPLVETGAANRPARSNERRPGEAAPAALPFGFAQQQPLAPLSADPANAGAPTALDASVQQQLSIAQDGQWLDSLTRDIVQSASGDSTLHFKLNPVHLGALTVQIAHSAEGASIRLTADSDAARNILVDAQPKLIAEARAQGLKVSETHVDVGQQNAGGGSSMRGGEAFAQQQHGGGGQSRQPLPDHKPFSATSRSDPEAADTKGDSGDLYA